MITTPQRPVRTAPFHMKMHETPVPTCGPLDSEVFQIGIYNIPGAQHNPCIFQAGDSLKVNVRVMRERGPFSDNFIARLEDDFTLTGAKMMKPKGTTVVRGPIRTPLSMNFPRPEDLRVFSWRGRLWAIGCVHDGKASPEWIRQALVELSPDGDEILQAQIIQSDRCEKNWMPCVNGDALSFIYSTQPLITIDVEGPTKIPSAGGIPQQLGTVRGGTQLIPYDGGWLAVVHQVYRPRLMAANYNPMLGGWAPPIKDPIAGDAPVVYLHQFAKFGRGLDTVELGAPWYFLKPGVEFCAGLVDDGGDRFIASFGVADKEAWLSVFSAETVEGTFAPKADG